MMVTARVSDFGKQLLPRRANPLIARRRRRKICLKGGGDKGFCLESAETDTINAQRDRSRTASSVGLSSFLLLLVLALLARLLPTPCQQPSRRLFTTRDGSAAAHVRSHDVHAVSHDALAILHGAAGA